MNVEISRTIKARRLILSIQIIKTRTHRKLVDTRCHAPFKAQNCHDHTFEKWFDIFKDRLVNFYRHSKKIATPILTPTSSPSPVTPPLFKKVMICFHIFNSLVNLYRFYKVTFCFLFLAVFMQQCGFVLRSGPFRLIYY